MNVRTIVTRQFKIGIVCEGQIDCAETRVFPKLVKLICPNAICGKDEIVPSGNRPRLLAIAPTVAKRLFDQGCAAVFVIWDVYPEWREHGGTVDCKVHRRTLEDNLFAANMTGKPIIPVAIHEELEAWLLCDADAIMEVIGARASKKPIRHERNPDRVSNPKTVLKHLFGLGRGKSYNESFSAGHIADKLSSIARLRKSQSFRHFEDHVKELCHNHA